MKNVSTIKLLSIGVHFSWFSLLLWWGEQTAYLVLVGHWNGNCGRLHGDHGTLWDSLRVLGSLVLQVLQAIRKRPCRLTFTWWGCCSLCLKPAELAHSILFCSCVCVSLYGPFNCISFDKFPNNSPLSHSVLPVLFLPYWSFQLYISLWKSPSALM